MASLDDILTASKNVVTAINNVAQTYLNVQGAKSQSNVTAATLVKSGSGRIASISVLTAGITAGHIYDTNAASSTAKYQPISVTSWLGLWNWELTFCRMLPVPAISKCEVV